MRISQLESKDYLGTSGVGTNSYLILNYDTEPAPVNTEEEADTNPPVTYKVQMNELGKGLIGNLNIVQYDANRVLKTLTNGETAYTNTTVGYYMDANDKNAIDSAVTAVSYDTTNKKLTRAIRNGTAADVVTTAQLLTDMDLNVNNISGFGTGKTLSALSESNGKITASFQDISILSSQISDRGTAGCVATLDAEGHIPSSQLPSYVDDILEGTLSTFPATGEAGKIYVDTSTNISYRWSGSQYTKVASDLSLGETSATAYRGDYGAQAYSWAYDAYTHAVTNKGIAKASGLYKITTNSEGHITAATAVEKSDITGLGIPGSDTTYEIDGTYDAFTNKVATVSTVADAVSGLYIKPASGIPASDLADTYFSIPELPTTDGTYTLQVVITAGEDPVFSWISTT